MAESRLARSWLLLFLIVLGGYLLPRYGQGWFDAFQASEWCRDDYACAATWLPFLMSKGTFFTYCFLFFILDITRIAASYKVQVRGFPASKLHPLRSIVTAMHRRMCHLMCNLAGREYHSTLEHIWEGSVDGPVQHCFCVISFELCCGSFPSF